MSAQVLQFKQKPVTGAQPKGPKYESLWLCTTCDSRGFQLELNGNVWCVNGHYIANLKVRS